MGKQTVWLSSLFLCLQYSAFFFSPFCIAHLGNQLYDSFNIHAFPVSSKLSYYNGKLIFSPDGVHMAITYANSNDKKLNTDILKCIDNKWVLKVTIPNSAIMNKISFSPDGSHFITVSNDKKVQIWSLVNEEWEFKAILSVTSYWSRAYFSPDGIHVMISSSKSLLIYKIVDNAVALEKEIIQPEEISIARFSPNGRCIVTALKNSHLCQIWRYNKEQKWELNYEFTDSGRLCHACFSPDGKLISLARDNGTCCILRYTIATKKWRRLVVLNKHVDESGRHGETYQTKFSPNGKYLAVISSRSERSCQSIARIIEHTKKGWLRKCIATSTEWMNVRFNNTSDRFLILSSDSDAQVWKLLKREWVRERDHSMLSDSHLITNYSCIGSTIHPQSRFHEFYVIVPMEPEPMKPEKIRVYRRVNSSLKLQADFESLDSLFGEVNRSLYFLHNNYPIVVISPGKPITITQFNK